MYKQRDNTQSDPNFNRSYDYSDIMIYRANRVFEKAKNWMIDYAVPIIAALIALTLFALIMMFRWMN